ncbi:MULTISPECIES: phosphatidate cytidylyltransferase [unclassified Treponema]|uniref:phosphatidate cytidylyltransferase n=1 Tax=unclassified Treponema TaxID=2638727 RepID=UPI0020A5F505|nr:MULTISPECIES: phosphatidate cytidylyltransferase [unclassified Treponema]UTC67480.1 phosphatidate cytidylyltransferase [Treponema sp. OMZ 789]UTC70208.1 phosphatidate cytidylyltransferase [Treponema sp. OMZ 790]UTC72923.1 phosphatidate cytidylyltransferase [Treponema sp. OMZ 791]
MKIRKIIERLIIFFVGAPLVLASIYFLPHYNFLVYHIELFIAALIANYEIYNILSQRSPAYPKNILAFFGLILLGCSYLSGLHIIPFRYIFFVLGCVIVITMFMEIIFSFSGNFTNSMSRFTTGMFMLIYPWGLSVYLSSITRLPNAGALIIMFYLMTFGCDSLAWFFGMLFGKSNRGFIKASPKKSIAGFIGGFIGSTAAAAASFYFFNKQFNGKLKELIIIALCTALFAIIGDIIESILKRSADLKDSGKVILGRGGILDSIDSLLVASPVFYSLCALLLGGV